MKLVIRLFFITIILTACSQLPVQTSTPSPTSDSIKTFLPTNHHTPTPGNILGIIPSEGDFCCKPQMPITDTVELEVAELNFPDFAPGVVLVHLEGNLPTSCHFYAARYDKPDLQNVIHVEVFSFLRVGDNCDGKTTLSPFNEDLSLGLFVEGSYSVEVNGQVIGEFDAETLGGVAIQPGVGTERDIATVMAVTLTSPQSPTDMTVITMTGMLPSACHLFQANVNPPNENNEIHLEVYSLYSATNPCISRAQSFQEQVLLGVLLPGTYSVWVNDRRVNGSLIVP